MKNKKAFMLGEYTLKIIIAVLCLLLLIYLLFAMYSNYQKEKDLRVAAGVLDKLGESMTAAKTNGPQDFTILGPGPKSWTLISYSFGEDRPLSCENSCICLCNAAPGSIQINYKGENQNEIQLNNCNEKGVCKNFNEVIKKIYLNPMIVGDVGDLKVAYVNEEFVVTKVVVK
jgi:hypothetical protein